MNTKNIVIAAVVLAVIFLGGSYIGKTVVNVNTPDGTTTSVNGVLGSNAGPVFDSYLTVGGLTEWNKQVPMAVATNTICAIKSPSATTTLEFAALDFSVSTTSAYQVELAKATTAYATTTRLAIFNGAANALVSLISTTTATALTDGIVPPNSWITAKMYGAPNTSTVSPVGTCSAVFRQFGK